MSWSFYFGKIQEITDDYGSEHEGSWLKERKMYLENITKWLNREVEDDVEDENEYDEGEKKIN
jgi:hypothetical protein